MKQVSLRTLIASLVLLVLVIVALAKVAFIMGWGDEWVKQRTQVLAQQAVREWDNEWYGVLMQQYPSDMMVYQDLVWKVKPDVFIETGTFFGGNALYLATLLEVVNPKAKILTVDIDPQYWKHTLKTLDMPGKEKLLQRIHFFEGSSTDPAVIAKMKEHIGANDKVMVLLDSAHSREHVFAELKAYSPLVSVNSYLIVNDTQWGEPLFALHDFLPTTDHFVVDAEVDRFFVSCAHGGYLRRVK